jgi:hypothetical protein
MTCTATHARVRRQCTLQILCVAEPPVGTTPQIFSQVHGQLLLHSRAHLTAARAFIHCPHLDSTCDRLEPSALVAPVAIKYSGTAAAILNVHELL